MKLIGLFVFSFAVFSGVAIAQDAPDLGVSLVALIEAFKGGAGPAAVIVAVVQLLKTDFLGNLLGKLHSGIVPLLVLLLGLVSGVLMDIGEGKSWAESLVQGLFNGGFALSLYDTIVKHFVKKTSA